MRRSLVASSRADVLLVLAKAVAVVAMRLEDVAARALALVAKALVVKELVAKVLPGRNPRRAPCCRLEARCDV